MGLINGSLQIGRSALLSYQAAMQVTGNNVANASNPNYTRQSARLSPISGTTLPDGSDPGAGVAVTGIERYIDEALEERLRGAISDMQSDDVDNQILARLESLYNELTDQDLSSSLSEFFNAWSELDAKPNDFATRSVVVEVGQTLANQIKTLRDDIIGVYNNLVDGLGESVDQINYLAEQLAKLNAQIANSSAAQKSPGVLLDQRDDLLKQLAELADINVQELSGGDVVVYLNSQPLVQYDRARRLVVGLRGDGDLAVPRVMFQDNQAEAQIRSGKVGAAIGLIDGFLTDNLNQLDALASAIIFEVNKLHSSGQGLQGFSSLTGEYSVLDAGAALNQAGLAFTPKNGGFLVTITDSHTQQKTVYQITVDLNGQGAETTLNDLAAQLDAIPALSAQVLANGKLRLATTSDNYSFTFSEDSSGVLAALGLNVFFTGTNAGNLAVQSDLAANPRLIAAAQTGEVGDGSNAGRIAALRQDGVTSLGGLALTDYYRSVVSGVGTRTAAAKQNLEIHTAVYDTLFAQRESISGVNLDEEAVNLLASQRAFQGAARFVNAVNEMLQELMNLI